MSIHHANRTGGLAEALEPRLLLAGAAAAVKLAPFSLPEKFLFKSRGLLTPVSKAKPLDIALAYLRAHKKDLGLTTADLADPIVTDQYTDRDTGLTHVYLQQRLNGLPVDKTSINVNIRRDGRILSVGGAFVSDAAAKAKSLPKKASIASRQSLQGLRGLGLKVPADSEISTALGRDSDSFVVPSVSLDPVQPQLHYVATSTGVAMAWKMAVRTPDGQHWYDTHVNAVTGVLVDANDWVNQATYDVYPMPIEAPNDAPSGIATRTLLTDPADPVASPYGWHDTNGVAGAEFTDTRGNNVSAQDDTDANNSAGLHPSGGTALNFDFPLDLTQSPSVYQSAAITNLFYWNNLLHDVHFQYGFTEVAGNFQTTNYGGTGLGNDAVQADAQDGSGTNNANFATPPDGSAPRMQMYLFTGTSPYRDGDLDAEIMVHEYGHGVSNRLTGGPANSSALSAVQSGGMGEGWSDWWSLMFAQKPTDTKTMAYGVGTYVLGQSTSGAGIRRFRYSYDMSIDPLTIDAYGTSGSGGGTTRSTEVHNTGEIWSTALWDLNWLLIDKYGYSSTIAQGYDPSVAGKNGGNNLALQLVMDGLKLQPANPSFLQARDAIIQADQVRTGGANLYQIWSAFARRGMGYSFVNSSSSGTSVTPAYDLPPGLLSPSVVLQTPTGTSTSPISSLDLTFSKAMDPTSFDISADVNSFVGPGGDDLKSQISSYSWINTNQTLHLSFSPQTLNGQYLLNVGPQILAASDGHAMDQNANGTPGEAGDTYTASFRYDATVGQVASTVPSDGSLVTVPLSSIEFNFSEAFAAASIGAGDLTINQGAVSGFSLIDADTVRFDLNGVANEGTLTLNIAAGAITDSDGNPMAAYSGSLATDYGTRAMPAFAAIQPAGSMVYQSSITGTIGVASDIDRFTINLDPGQSLSAVVHPTSPSLRPGVSVLDPSGVVLGSSTAAAATQDAVVQLVPAAVAGTYTIVVHCAGTTSGSYSVQALLNASVESEEHNGPANDSIATAQPLIPAAPLPNGSSVTSVLGKLPPSTGIPLYTEGFESGTLSSAWATYSSNSYGRIQISSAYGAAAGAKAMLMDRNDSSGTAYTLNEAIWTTDLTGITQATLSFAHASFSDEDDLLAADFTGHANGDGVSISDDGVNWHRVWQAISSGTTFSTVTLDLAAAAAAAGMSLGAGFQIKIQQYDNFDLGTDGRGWDAITITTPASNAGDYYAVALDAGESASFAVSRLGRSAAATLKLYDAANNLLATGSSSATNVHSAIGDFVAPSGGTYYVLVNALGDEYALTVTQGAAFDLEPNNGLTQPQGLGPAGVVLGYLENGAAGLEPDDYTIGAVLTSVAPGIILSAQGDANAITSQTGMYASTGARVFAHGAATDWYSNLNWLRADFSATASSVSIDVVPNDSYDPGIMRAYNSAGTLLQEVISAAPPTGSFATLTITRPSSDIAYVLASGLNGDTVLLDHLVVGGIAAGQDFYTVPATLNDTLTIRTLTPGDGPNEFANTLDPRIEIFDPSGVKVAFDDNGGPDGRNAALTYVAQAAGNYRIRVASSSAGTQNVGEYVLHTTVASLPILSVTLPGSAREGDGALNGTLNISTAAVSDLAVILSSSDAGRLNIQSTVIIPAGQTSAPLSATIIDNALLDGSQPVTISAAATDCTGGSAIINVLDNETAALTVSLPATAREGDAALVGTITSSAPPTRDIAVQLVSDGTSRLTVPSTVTLLAGQTTASFTATVINNTVIDQTPNVTVTSSVENWTSGTTTVAVDDNDNTMTVTLPVSSWEGLTFSAAGTVRIGGTLASDLVVNLASDDTTELTVPATVTIPAGQTSATFPIALPGDSLKDGTQTANVTASAAGLPGAGSSVMVHDAYLDHLMFDTITGPRTAGTAFSTTVRAYNIANEVIAVYAGLGTLRAAGLAGSLPVTPSTINFSAGIYIGNVMLTIADPSVGLSMFSGGVSASSNTFAVQPGAATYFTWGAISSPQIVNVPFPQTLTAKDDNGNVATSFNGTVNLSGQVGTATSQTMLPSPTFTNSANYGSFTVGYAFTPNANIEMTHIRSYFGGKVSIWTNAGTLLVSQAVSGTPTAWTETALSTPLQLSAGTTYRITVYTAGQTYYWRNVAPTNPSFATLGQSYERSGDGFPTSASNGWWLVDLRGNVGTFATTPVTPTTATFANGLWSGNITMTQGGAAAHLHADDGAGHFGDSGSFDVVPAAPSAPDLADASDSGISNSDNLTNAAAPVFNVATAGTSALVELLRDGVVVSSRTGPGNLTDAAVPEGTFVYTTRQSAGAGNTSDPSAGLTVTFDTTAPTHLGVPTFVATGAQGLSYSFSEDVAAGFAAEDVTVQNLTTSSTVSDGFKTLTSLGSNRVLVTFTGYAGSILPDGSYSSALAASGITDSAGNALAGGNAAYNFIWAGGSNGDDAFTVQLDAAGTTVLVFQNGATANFSATRDTLGTIAIGGGAGDDTLTFDLNNGGLNLPDHVRFDGGSDATAAGDTLKILGRSGAADTVEFDADAVAFNNGAGGTVDLVNVEHSQFDGRRGYDDVTVGSLGNVEFTATQQLGALQMAAGSSASLLPGADKVLIVKSLSSVGALVDLHDNALIWDYADSSPLAALQSLIAAARADGNWTGPDGLTSTTARDNPRHNTALGAMEAGDYQSIYGQSAGFEGESIDDSALVVKYTYNGDTDLNGTVNFDDYSRIDLGFNTQTQPGFAFNWLTGDFDFNNSINFDDYSLIDLAFNTQGLAL